MSHLDQFASWTLLKFSLISLQYSVELSVIKGKEG